MPWAKSPPELIALFDSALPADPSVERKQMFGYPCAIVNGHMFSGLHESNMVVKLPAELLEQFLVREGARPFAPMPDRPMNGFAVVPDRILHDPAALRDWVEKAFLSAATLPPKEKKARATAKKARAKSALRT